MGRAERRLLERKLRRQVGGVKTPDSVTLRGGPMDGWTVKPDAPALQRDWRAKYIDELARTAHELTRRETAKGGAFGLDDLPTWEQLSEAGREHFRAIVRAEKGDGHYELGEPGRPRFARWIPA